MCIDLAGQNLILRDLEYAYEGNTAWTLLLHDISCPWSYGPEDLTDMFIFVFSMSIDQAGQNLILMDPRQVLERI